MSCGWTSAAGGNLLDELPEAIDVDVWAVTVLRDGLPRARRFPGPPATSRQVAYALADAAFARKAGLQRDAPDSRRSQAEHRRRRVSGALRWTGRPCAPPRRPTERADTITANAEDQRAAQAAVDTPNVDRRRRACPVPPGWHGERRR